MTVNSIFDLPEHGCQDAVCWAMMSSWCGWSAVSTVPTFLQWQYTAQMTINGIFDLPKHGCQDAVWWVMMSNWHVQITTWHTPIIHTKFSFTYNLVHNLKFGHHILPRLYLKFSTTFFLDLNIHCCVVCPKMSIHAVHLLMDALFTYAQDKCKWLLALMTDGHTLNKHDLCYIEGRWWYKIKGR